ncbi:AEC family transporter [Aerophototrophica crusticola]|uniref:AEC family transporter n=1 Tax=Aerophototrophica crusticola TaxID=1709002 RepID=A0A858R7E5_9PROT|nr:AEC family transporter [Rhodospirillaceae bacterium B3]
MTAVVLALAPIFLLIVLGFGLRRFRVLPDHFWPPAEKLTYYVLFPALLVDSTAKADLAGLDIVGLGGSLLAAMLCGAALVLALRPWLATDGPAFTSVFQGAVRVNTYVGLAAGSALHGREGTALMAIGVIAIVPMVNVLSVLVLTRWGRKEGPGRATWRQAVKGVLTNPLILSVTLGALLNALGIHAVPVVSPLLSILGAASLPLGLLAVGAGLDFSAVRAAGASLVAASVMRLAVVPGITLGVGSLWGLGPLPLVVAVLYNGLPTSASAYVLARQMGGDSGLMAGIITAQTLAAALTLPLWLWVVSLV